MSKKDVVRVSLRLPPDVWEAASVVAEGLRMSLNTFIVQAVESQAQFHGRRLMAERRAAASLTQPPRRPVAAPAPSPAVMDDDAMPEPDEFTPVRRTAPKVGANQPCPCGSGKKYKRCHGAV